MRKSGQNKVQCKYCGLEFADSVKKIKAHLAFEWHDGMRGITVCDKCPDQKRRAIQNTADNEFRTKQKKKRQQREEELDEREGKKPKQGKVDTAFAKQEKKIVDNAIGRFFFANGLSFNAADSSEYKGMVKELKTALSGYQAPGRESQ